MKIGTAVKDIKTSQKFYIVNVHLDSKRRPFMYGLSTKPNCRTANHSAYPFEITPA